MVPIQQPDAIRRGMFRSATISAALIGALLACVPMAMAAPDDDPPRRNYSAKKKKADSGASEKKKASADDASSAATSAVNKKGAGTTLDLPLPAKHPVVEASEGAKDPSAEKKDTSPEKAPATSEKKNGESATPTTPEKAGAPAKAQGEHAPNATVEPDSIVEFASQPPRIQQMIRDAIDLTRLNLTYTFGSDNPDNGGMDCSGTIYYLLKAHGFNGAARDSAGQYLWARKSGAFFPVIGKDPDGVELNELMPGDLMFWTGTYESGHDIPISHVMLYLGREKGSNKRIMFGASDGRSYNGVPRWGVSVFDFKMPKADPANPEKAKADFVGYARIPGLRSGVATVAETVAATDGTAKPTPKPTPASSRKKKGSSRKGN